jgi:uncharacterized protein
VLTALAEELAKNERIVHAVLFGSAARDRLHPGSDLDIAVSFRSRATVSELGALLASLEAIAGVPVDLVLLDEVGPVLAHRIAKEGVVLVDRDHEAFVSWKKRAIVEYLDFKPIEERCIAGVLKAARRDR